MKDKHLYIVMAPMNARKSNGEPHSFKGGETIRKTGESQDKRTIRIDFEGAEYLVDSEDFKRAKHPDLRSEPQ